MTTERKKSLTYLRGKLMISLLLIVSSLYGQKLDIPEPIKVIGLCVTSITLDAVSDALIADNRNLVLAHSLDAVNIGMLISSPWILDIDKTNWFWYVLTYTSFRIALFDPVYNYTRGYPALGHRWHPAPSHWDRFMNEINPPPGAELYGRSVFFVLAITIPIGEMR